MLRTLQRRSDGVLARKIRSVAEATLRASYNSSYQFETNGEQRALRIALTGLTAPVVLDVGANVGDWALNASKCLGPDGVIYAFEPSPAVFSKMQARTQFVAAIRPKNFGLSEKDGPLVLHASEQNSQKASVESAGVRAHNKKVMDYQAQTLHFRRGADVTQNEGIKDISYLKIDTEGHDYSVLIGFSEMLAAGRIRAIQFEYNALNIFARHLLYDFYQLLGARDRHVGYTIGRIYPSSVDFKPFETRDENFIDGNFLAVRSDLTELIAALQKRSSLGAG